MPFIPALNVAEVHIRGTLLGQDVENTFYYEKSGGILQTDLDTLVGNIASVVASDWIPNLSVHWSGREVYARDMTTLIAAQATDASIAGDAGAISGDCAPSYVTLAVKRSSGLTGRSARGRIFWMGIPETWLVGNGLGSGVVNAIILNLEAVDQAAVTAGFTPVIISKYGSGAPRATALIFDLLTWSVSDSLTDTRRSRKA